jgi:6-pyruvoyltetrahydropterin/6-carboxytetrahydropterin synthase
VSAVASTTRRFSFSAGHRYWVAGWSEAENRRVFGALTVPHGHNYTLDVTVRGSIDERTGMVMDLAELKRIVGDLVVARFDHADLAADPLFRDRVPTTENIAIAVWALLAPALGAERLWQVRLWEDPTFYVDYRGGRP